MSGGAERGAPSAGPSPGSRAGGALRLCQPRSSAAAVAGARARARRFAGSSRGAGADGSRFGPRRRAVVARAALPRGSAGAPGEGSGVGAWQGRRRARGCPGAAPGPGAREGRPCSPAPGRAPAAGGEGGAHPRCRGPWPPPERRVLRGDGRAPKACAALQPQPSGSARTVPPWPS